MNRGDFLKLVGAADVDYCPVALLLRDGRGCAGYYNARLNEGLEDTCVLVNARIVGFQEPRDGLPVATIASFAEFIEEIVLAHYQSGKLPTRPSRDAYGQSIPLTALAFDHIAVLYPVAHIEALIRRAAPKNKSVPSFLDFDNKSVILKLLRTKLW